MSEPDEKVVLVEQLRDFRRKVVKGEPVHDDELKDAIARLRRLRDTTSSVAKKSATKKAVKKITQADAEDLLKDLL